MKNTFLLLGFITLALACEQAPKTASVESVSEMNIEALQAKKAVYTVQHNSLTQSLNEINAAIEAKSGNEKRVLVSAFTATPQRFDHTIELQANINTRKNVELYPELGGRLKEIRVQEGQKVKKGTLLALFDDSGMQDQVEQLELQMELAKTGFERTQRLWEQKIGSEMMFLEAQTRYKALVKQVSQMKDQLAKSKVYAPFDGIVDEIIAKVGATLAPGMSPILRIVNLDEMYLEADAPESYLAQITIGSKATVFIPVLNLEQATEIRQTGNFIQASNRTFRIEAPIENPEGIIKPNLNAKISIIDYSNEAAILIPQRVIRENAEDSPYVFVLTQPDQENGYVAEQRFITLGKTKEEWMEIVKGIAPGDIVVDDGASTLSPNQKVKRILE